MPVEKHLFRLLDSLLKNLRRDSTVIDIEKRDVIEGHLVKLDDELHQVRVSLLPERLLPLAKQVVQKRGNVVGQCVGIEVIVQGVVPILRIETDLDVIRFSSVMLEDSAHLMTKVAFNFEHQPTNSFCPVVCLIREDLVCKRVHAATRFAG